MAAISDKPKFLQRVGQNVHQLRNTAGLSQVKLAEKAELDPRTIARIEKGEINLLVTTIRRLALALECSYDQLLRE